MERQLWKVILRLLDEVYKPTGEGGLTYTSRRIVEIWVWSVIYDRPVSWACRPGNWPLEYRRDGFPSNTTMSRRLRSRRVKALLEIIEERMLRPNGLAGIVWMIDGKPMPISGCSKDRQAGYGKAAGAKAKGYKLHVILGKNDNVAAWRVAPMNKDERVMARRMLLASDLQGYVVADSNYDSNKLHHICDVKGNLQLVAPRRYGKHRGHGHRKQTPGRMRSKEILENPFPYFGNGLLALRKHIERFYGTLTNWGGALTCLPPWVRTHRRVHRWIQAKLILNAARIRLRETTYVNS